MTEEKKPRVIIIDSISAVVDAVNTLGKKIPEPAVSMSNEEIEDSTRRVKEYLDSLPDRKKGIVVVDIETSPLRSPILDALHRLHQQDLGIIHMSSPSRTGFPQGEVAKLSLPLIPVVDRPLGHPGDFFIPDQLVSMPKRSKYKKRIKSRNRRRRHGAF